MSLHIRTDFARVSLLSYINKELMYTGLENSTRLLIFTSASGPQAAGQVKILIFLVKIKFFPMYAISFVMQGK